MQNIIFRADSSATIGAGHIMRDLVLAKEYPKANIIFATQELAGNINHKILEAGYTLELLHSNEIEEFIEVVQRYKATFVVIDSYRVDYNYERTLKENTAVELLVLDDTYEKHYCDILLNHNISADKAKYINLVPEHCELRCGAKFTLLREEFLQQFPPRKKDKKINILVAMGGVDSSELNIKILKLLSSFDNIHAHLITTSGNKKLQELRKYVDNKEHITLHIDCDKVAYLMHSTDFAIVTPSVTVNEVYFMNLPFIAIQTASNQQSLYEWLEQNNYLTLKSFNETYLREEIEFMFDLLESNLVNFTQLNRDEKVLVLKWRNSDFIKKWMYNRTEIDLKKHLEYIDMLKTKEDRVYFLVKCRKEAIGVVNLSDIKSSSSAELGIYMNPELRAYGRLLIYKLIEYAFKYLKLKCLYANVYVENINAIRLYEKLHFQRVTTLKDVNGELLCMELKNENR